MEIYAAGALIGAPLLFLANKVFRGGFRCRRKNQSTFDESDVFDQFRHTCTSKCPEDCDGWVYSAEGGGGEASADILLARLKAKHRGEDDVDDTADDQDSSETRNGDVVVTRSVKRHAALKRRVVHRRNESNTSDWAPSELSNADGVEFDAGNNDDWRADEPHKDDDDEESEEEQEVQQQHQDHEEDEEEEQQVSRSPSKKEPSTPRRRAAPRSPPASEESSHKYSLRQSRRTKH